MKKHKFRLAAGRVKKKRALPAKLAVICLLILAAIVFIAGYLWNSFKDSDYFRIKEVVCKEAQGIDLSYLEGRNIFIVDLEKESRYIKTFHPDYKKVKLVRVFPNRIFVYFVKRKPVALVKLYKYFILDKEGVLYNAPEDIRSLDIPVIVGLETKIFGPRSGKKYNIKEIELALTMIREFQRVRLFRNYKIKKIYVKKLSDSSIFLIFPPETSDYSKGLAEGVAYQGLEVKIGQDNIRRKFAILAGIIARGNLDLANTKYIDLRFNKPVIKYNAE